MIPLLEQSKCNHDAVSLLSMESWRKEYSTASYISNILNMYLSILIKTQCGVVCMFVNLSDYANLFRLKSDRHDPRHVGPLGT